MREDTKITESIPKNTLLKVIICECILAVLIISASFTLKYFFKKEFLQTKNWYSENLMTYTSISDIVNGAKNEV